MKLLATHSLSGSIPLKSMSYKFSILAREDRGGEKVPWLGFVQARNRRHRGRKLTGYRQDDSNVDFLFSNEFSTLRFLLDLETWP